MANDTLTLTYSGELTIVACWCGMTHAVPTELYQHMKNKHRDGKPQPGVYCPLGHNWIIAGDSEASRLRRQLEAEQQRASRLVDQVERERRYTEHERRRAAAARGQLTKLRNRVAKGLCPQAGCKRSFTSLHDHVKDCHPELVEALDES